MEIDTNVAGTVSGYVSVQTLGDVPSNLVPSLSVFVNHHFSVSLKLELLDSSNQSTTSERIMDKLLFQNQLGEDSSNPRDAKFANQTLTSLEEDSVL
jgi:hypothetical protein